MKQFLLAFGAFLTFSLGAQTPDPSFEQAWVTSPAGYPAKEAVGWMSTNVLTHGLCSPTNPTSVVQSTFNCAGVSGMRIETEKFTLGALAGLLPDTCGFAFTGAVVVFPQPRLVDGFPYDQRPTQITYCYQTTPVAGDTSGVGVALWKWTGSSRLYIGGAKNTYTGTVSTVTNATLNISYTSTLTPDSMSIYVASSYKFNGGTTIGNKAKKGSLIWVDNFVYPASTVGVKEQPLSVLEAVAYPNPANTSFYVSTENGDAKNVEIIDLTGKVIEKAELNNGKAKLDVSKYHSGIYLYSITDKNNQRLKTNKFTVNH